MPIYIRKRAGEEGILSTTRGKRARNEENNEDQNTEVEFSGLSEELLGNGDTEVFSTLIPMMKNVCILKTCRLVCKSWNQFACRALRKHSRVYYSVDEDYPHETDSQLKLMEGNVHLGLPSPFRIFKVRVTSLKEEPLLRILKYLRETTSDFLMDLTIFSGRVDPSELQAVLTCNQNNLKIIKLELDGKIINHGFLSNGKITDHRYDEIMFQPEVIRLPFLRTLRITRYSLTHERVVSLCENICRYSPLQSVAIWSKCLEDGLKKVMYSLAMKSVKKLYLDFSVKLSLDSWDFVRASIFKIQGIKKLSIYHPDTSTNRDCFEKFEIIINHFTDSVEFLAGNYLPRFNYKYFPKLREIKDAPFDFDFYYPVERYPLLRKATLDVGCRDIFRAITEEPNLAIQQLSFESPDGVVTDPDSLLKAIYLAGWRFPNVSNFSIDCEEIHFTSAMLSVICQSFPKLRALELRVFLRDKKTLSGLRENFLEWLHEGWPLERIPREPSLLDFSGLEKFTLGPSVLITKSLFLYCLSKMSKLQYLTFYLNGDVSAIDARKSVGHLKRIRVIVSKSFNPREKWVEEMERLRTMLPTVVEIKKIK